MVVNITARGQGINCVPTGLSKCFEVGSWRKKVGVCDKKKLVKGL